MSSSNTAVNTDNQFLHFSKFSDCEVTKALKKLKPKTTMGPDGIPSFLLRDCATVLAKPIAFLFNLSLKEHAFPDVLKRSKLIPIFKKDDRHNIENYRPITIINNLSKAFEFLLYEPLFTYARNSITEYQHGFMKGRSTVTNLCCITQYITNAFDDNSQVDVIYTDFSKAFDKLNHCILLNKLRVLGLSESLLIFFSSYLNNRTSYVECNGVKSDEFIVSSGVPQGSVLGPLFFNIFINDIVQKFSIPCLLYADDLKLYTRVTNVSDCLNLQVALNNLEAWCSTNHLQLNISKCFVVTYTKKINNIIYDYSLSNCLISRCNNIRDLGVTFDSKLSFSMHIQNITNKAFKSLGFVIRNSHDFQNIETLKLLYNAYIRSSLEYGSVVWSPCYNIHIDNLEKIQRRFLKFLSFKTEGVYPAIGIPHVALLEKFEVCSLKHRRNISDIIFIHKLIEGEIDCANLLSNLNFHIPRLTSRQNATFSLPTPRTNAQENSPVFRMCINCNHASKHIDIFACSTALIKNLPSLDY